MYPTNRDCSAGKRRPRRSVERMFLTNLERHTDLECVYIREHCINCTKQYNEGVSQKKIKKLQPSASNGPLEAQKKKKAKTRAPHPFSVLTGFGGCDTAHMLPTWELEAVLLYGAPPFKQSNPLHIVSSPLLLAFSHPDATFVV